MNMKYEILFVPKGLKMNTGKFASKRSLLQICLNLVSNNLVHIVGVITSLL